MKNYLSRRLRILLGAQKLVVIQDTAGNGYEGVYQCRGQKAEVPFTLDHNNPQFAGLNGLPDNLDHTTVARKLYAHLKLGETGQFMFYRERRKDTFYIYVASFSKQISIKQKMIGRELFGYHIDHQEKEKLHQQNTYLTESVHALVRISKVMLESMDFELLLTEINNTVKELLGAGGAGLLLYDEDKKQLVLQKPAFDIQEEKIISEYRVSIEGKGNAVNVFLKQEPYCSNDARSDPVIMQNLVELFDVTNLCSVPLIVGNRCIGVFHVINKEGGFNSEDISLIRLFVSQIAVVIENTRLFSCLRIQEEKMRRLYQNEKETCAKFKNLMDFHQQLTMNLLSGSGFAGITDELSRYLSLPVLFFDHLSWKKYISHLPSSGKDNLRPEMEWLSKKCETRAKELMEHAMRPYRDTFSGPQGEKIPAVVSAIRVDKEMLGMLFVRENGSELGPFEMLAVERAVYMFALELMKEKMLFEVEHDLKGEFFGALSNWDNTQDESDLMRRAKYFGYDLNFPQLVAVMEIGQTEIVSSDSLDNEQQIFNLKRRLLRLVNELIENNHFQGVASVSAKGVNLLIGTSKVKSEALLPAAHRFIAALQKSIAAGMNTKVTIGIGDVAHRLEDIQGSYQQALNVIDFLNKTDNNGQAMHFNELGIYKILLHNQEGKQLEKFAYEQLERLIKHDSQYRTSFLLTLEKYFNNDSNLRATADDLFIHINTMRYRLESIQDKFGIDLSSPEKKLNINFAIKILSFTRPELFKKNKELKGPVKAG